MRPISVIACGALTMTTIIGGTTAYAQDATGTTTPDSSVPDSSVPAPAPMTPSTVTLPLLGVPLTVDITTDAGGGLLDVSLGSPDDFIATGVRSRKVTFVNETAGTAVKISAKHGGQKISARAGSLADILGPGGWSGDLFETGEVSTVEFVVSDRGDGTPDITVNQPVAAAADIDVAVGETKYSVENDDDDGEMEASARVAVTFSSLGQTRTLVVQAKVETEIEDGVEQGNAQLRISLGRIKGRQIVEGDAVGPHTWTGAICAGPASISYEVGADGSINVTGTEPAGAEVRSGGGHDDDDHDRSHQAQVRFSTGERVSIKVTGQPGAFELSVSKRVRCDETDPTVNTDETDDARDDHDDRDGRRGDERGEHDDDDHDDDHDDDRRGDHDDDDDDHDDDRGGRDRGGDHDDDGRDHDDD